MARNADIQAYMSNLSGRNIRKYANLFSENIRKYANLFGENIEKYGNLWLKSGLIEARKRLF